MRIDVDAPPEEMKDIIKERQKQSFSWFQGGFYGLSLSDAEKTVRIIGDNRFVVEVAVQWAYVFLKGDIRQAEDGTRLRLQSSYKLPLKVGFLLVAFLIFDAWLLPFLVSESLPWSYWLSVSSVTIILVTSAIGYAKGIAPKITTCLAEHVVDLLEAEGVDIRCIDSRELGFHNEGRCHRDP